MYKFSLILFFIIILCQTVDATDYYVSSSDITANDSNSGTSPTTPWKSISKVNSMFSSLQPGDRILFNRGDTLYGTIKITKSGTAGSPITLGAYGEGLKPVITGFVTLTGWKNEGNGIFSVVVTSEARTNVVIVDNVQFGMGRYPDSGYLIYETYSGSNSITDNDLPSNPDWTGAEAVIRLNDWALNRNKINSHINHTINYTSYGVAESGMVNHGYFIQNDLRCVTKTNEWYHSSSDGKLYIYGDPTLKEVKMATINNIVYCNGYDYITIDGLAFEGSISDAINFPNGSTNIIIQNSHINFSGKDGVFINNSGKNLIDNNIIENSGEAGIFIKSSNHDIITNNTITSSGTIAGIGNTGTFLSGIYLRGDDELVQYNNIISSASNGIAFWGNRIEILNNFFNNSLLLLNDGGALYTGGSTYTGRIIEDNIILNTIGDPKGTSTTYHRAHGIYLDEFSANIEVSQNTIAHSGICGIKLHKAHDNIIKNNITFNNWEGIGLYNSLSTSTIYNNDIFSNIFFAKTTSQYSFRIQTSTNDIIKFGKADLNYYVRPIDDDDVVSTYQPSTGNKNRTLENWQSFTGQDLNSHKSPIAITDVNTILFEYNATKTDKTVTLSKPMIDVTGKKYTGSVTLAPYTSVILMVDPNPAQTMTPVYQSSVIENATPSVLTMTYDQTLANVIPPVTAFKVFVNGTERTFTKVSISGTKVQLTLASPVVYGDNVTVAYNKPPTNPFLQATSGDPAETITAQNVINNVNPPNPVYVSAVVENATPSRIEITYNLSLKTVSLSPSAFAVKVNTIARTVSSVVISGSKVLLTLSSPVAYGDIVTVAYTKPSTNFIQTPDGGQAVSFTAKTVTNNVSPAAPVYVSSVIEDATPSLLEITFNMSLTNIVPVNSAFTVTVNSSVSSLISVSVSGTKVNLTLASPVKFGDKVTVAYSKPASGQLQTSSGAQVASFTAQPVTNNCIDPALTLFPPVIITSYEPNAFSGKVYEIDASGSTDPNNDILTFSWSAPSGVDISSNTGSKIRFLAPVVTSAEVITIGLSVSDGTMVQSKNLQVNIMPYKPDLAMGKVDIVEASNSYSADYPDKAIDGDPFTKWSMEGDNHWLRFDMPGPFKISHLLLSFLPDQNYESYFDIYASGDRKSWDPVFLNAKSCDFSGGPQVFDFPLNKTSTDYTSIKLVGHGNSLNSWNYFSEFKLFGSPGEAPDTIFTTPENIFIYPNPASEFINVLVLEPFEKAQNLRIIDFSGRLVQEILLEPGLNNIKIPLNLKPGIYVTQVILGKLITFSQKLLVSH